MNLSDKSILVSDFSVQSVPKITTSRLSKLIWGLLTLVLLIAASVQLFSIGENVAKDAVHLPPLIGVLPVEIEGWKVQDSALGATEGDDKMVKEILQYDDTILRTYTQGGITVGVHVVYWKPESGEIGELRSHSPDFCFPASGWERVVSGYERVVQAGRLLSAPGQYRVFEAQSQRMEVLFWHLQAGGLSGHHMGEQTRWAARFPYILKQFLNSFPRRSRKDEIFVRITSTVPFETLAENVLFERIAQSLSVTGAFHFSAAGNDK